MTPPADIPGLPSDITPIIVFLAIGLIAGWLASLVLGGGGLLRNLIVGVIGSFVGGYVLNLAGVRLQELEGFITLTSRRAHSSNPQRSCCGRSKSRLHGCRR